MKHFFIDTEIYFQNKRQPPRKVELFYVRKLENDCMYQGFDEDGNEYILPEKQIIFEE